MLINWHAPKHIYIVCGKTDLRKGIDGLAIVIAENFGLELYDDSLFLFCGFRNDRFKGLYWDGEGFILLPPFTILIISSNLQLINNK
ncbi:IS66 family insertion sequence element accessory protein TnpB [Lactobacillus reuteri]|uniref:IS66 family insertion sequence element accessory protein TnpB n=1 Tax=Limosilactobacillus reuteri TaxID=1598 RepID=UPI00146ED3F5|nr:IS66 family insertion sequence element accessory protein TnpB [Limosilactobacillus reuteri]NMV53462.1 IS66 family insertion sequence element accessory protein TnpB [Limosilactobacillus reuteri]NMV57915.1 IS66 family insertion sequence element accessory protein TnpB [Limosilactobacillus reuteri]